MGEAKPKRLCAKCDRTESYKGLCSEHWREQNNLGSNRRAKLSDDEVREIRRLRAEGVDRWALAHRYGVTAGTITTIAARRSRANVD